jgi:hypothetical protein
MEGSASERRAAVNRLSPVGYDENEVVDTCGRAARRLWTRPGSVASRATHLDSLVGDLLNAIATAVAMDEASVPEGVQRAAVRVARSVRAGHERGAPAGHHDHDLSSGRGGGVRPGAGREAVGGEDVPFTASIRLGRMG